MRKRSWTIDQLREAAKESVSYRQVIYKLGLIPAGGNYRHIMSTVSENGISVVHFTGKIWNKGKRFGRQPQKALADILTKGVPFQSYKLKIRLFESGLKNKCVKYVTGNNAQMTDEFLSN